MPPRLLNRELRAVRAIAGWQDSISQLATGQTIGVSAPGFTEPNKSRAEKTLFKASATYTTYVILLVEVAKEAGASITVGSTSFTVALVSTGTQQVPFSFYLGAGVKWKWEKLGAGAVAVFSTYQIFG